MQDPSFRRCAGVFAARVVLMLNAWWIVGLALLVGAIRKGPIRRGQHNGETVDMAGNKHVQGDNYLLCSATVPRWLSWYDTPDEPGPFPAYEPTVMAVFYRCGWAATVFYNLALRNVAHGWLKANGVQSDREYTNAEMRREKFGIGYGWKCYRDWRAESAAPHGAIQPTYYLVPSFFNNESKES